MQEIFNNIMYGVRLVDVIDIALVAFLFYKLLVFIHETRAEQLVKGLLVIVFATFVSDKLKLYTLNWLLVNAMTLGAIALIIVFQPELRRALESIGRSQLIRTQFVRIDKEKAKSITASLVRAIDYFSSKSIGALIVLEQETALSDISESGTKIDAEISTELMGNIFYEGSPLHDGATIIRGDRILAAGCVLPLTQDKTLSRDLGTRHRAGLGITENSDAVVFIVSEETGIISQAVNGKLIRFLDIKSVEKAILNLYLADIDDKKTRVPFADLFRRKKDAKK